LLSFHQALEVLRRAVEGEEGSVSIRWLWASEASSFDRMSEAGAGFQPSWTSDETDEKEAVAVMMRLVEQASN